MRVIHPGENVTTAILPKKRHGKKGWFYLCSPKNDYAADEEGSKRGASAAEAQIMNFL